MARSDKRFMVYPAEKATEIIGTSAPELNQAIDCWGAQLARATARNTQDFWVSKWDSSLEEPMENPLNEWNVMARALKGRNFDPEYANPGELLATAVEDICLLDRLDIQVHCFSPDLVEDGSQSLEIDLDEAIKKLTQKLRGLDYVRSWAVIWAVQWYWRHCSKVDLSRDDWWWTLDFRRKWPEVKSGEVRKAGRNSKAKK